MNKIHSNIVTDPAQLDIPQYIDQPQYVKNKATNYTIQALGWFVWTLFILPLLSLILWLYQGRLIQSYIFAEQMNVQMYNFAWLALIVVVCCASLLLWASYNWLRYRKRDNPKVLNVSQSILAQDFLITTDELSRIQKSKSIVLHYDEEGILYNYELKKA